MDRIHFYLNGQKFASAISFRRTHILCQGDDFESTLDLFQTYLNTMAEVSDTQLQTARAKSWPATISSYTKVKHVSKFNNNHDEVNYPQVSALARVRGSSGNKRRNTGEIIEYGGNTCAKSCRPQLLM